MNHFPEPTPDHLETALEATCGALVALESVQGRPSDPRLDVAQVQRQMSGAIESIRQAIAELRLARDEDASVVGLGFVLGTNSS